MRKALFLLGILDDGDLDWMIGAGVKLALPAGAELIREGTASESVYVVLSGMLVVRTAGTGDTVLARLRSGEIVGEMSFVDSRPPSASVHAAEPSAVLAIPRAALAAELAADVQFAARFYRALAVFLSERLRATVGLLDYGRADPPRDADIAPDVLDNVAIAGARFEWLQRRLESL